MTSLDHTRTIIECPLAWSSQTAFKNDTVFPQPTIYSTLALSPTSSQTIISGENSPAYRQSWPNSIRRLTKNRPSLGGATGASGAKLVLVGDQAVGKTTLVRKFSRGTFNEDYKATIGIDFEVVRFRVLNIPFSVQLWDTAGQERFRAMSSQYYRKAKVVFIVADASDPRSIANVENWNSHVEESVENSEGIFKFLILAKTDLIATDVKRQKIYVECEKLAKTINAEFWPCSSNTHENVDELFHRAVSLVFMQCCFEEIHDRDYQVPVRRSRATNTKPDTPLPTPQTSSPPKLRVHPPVSHVVDLSSSVQGSVATQGTTCCNY